VRLGRWRLGRCGCGGVGTAGERRRWLACKDGTAMLHCRPIMVQGERKDKKEREKLIELCCEACAGGCSKVVTVSVGGRAGVACARKRTAMLWLPLSCNSLKRNENKKKKHLTQCFGRAKWVGWWGGCVACLHARGQCHCPATCNRR